MLLKVWSICGQLASSAMSSTERQNLKFYRRPTELASTFNKAPGNSNVCYSLRSPDGWYSHDHLERLLLGRQNLHTILRNNGNDHMIFLKLKSKFPITLFSFFSLTVTSNFFLTQATLLNSFKMILFLFVCIYFLGFISSSWILSFGHANYLFILFLNNAASLICGCFFTISFKYSCQ